MTNALKITALSISDAEKALNSDTAYDALKKTLIDFYSLANARVDPAKIDGHKQTIITLTKDQMDTDYTSIQRVELESDTNVTMIGLYKKDDPKRINKIYWGLWYNDKISNDVFLHFLSSFEHQLDEEGANTSGYLDNLGMHVITDSKDNIIRAISN